MRAFLIAAAVLVATTAAPAFGQSTTTSQAGVGSSPGVAGVPGAADANGGSAGPNTATTKHHKSGGSTMAMDPRAGSKGSMGRNTPPAGSNPNGDKRGQGGNQPSSTTTTGPTGQ